MLPCRCHMPHCTPSECWQVRPRWSTSCWCQFKYSMHACEGLSSCFKRNDSPSVPQEVSETVHMHTSWVGCHHSRRFIKSVPVCRATRTLHTWKTWFTHRGWFWRGSLRQQKPSASNLAFLSAQLHQLCIKVNGRTFEHPVSIGNKLQLFSEYYSGFALFPTSVAPTLMIVTLHGHMLDIRCLTIYLCFGPSYPLTKFKHGVFPHLYTSI